MRYLCRRIALLGLSALLLVGCDSLPLKPGADRGQTPEAAASDSGVVAPDAVHVTPIPTTMPSADALAQALQDTDGRRRVAAAWSLPERDDISIEARVGLLTTALAQQVSAPDQGATPEGSYLPADAFTRLHFTRALTELGPEAVPALSEAVDDVSGETREHLLIALTYAGDRDVLPEVRALVTQAADPVVRMDAARALGKAGDQDAVAQLEAALQDPYVVTAEDHLGPYTIYPVREQAAAALRTLGVPVERQDDAIFLIGEQP